VNGLGEAGDSGNPAEWPRYIRTTDIRSLTELDPERRVTLPPELAAQAPVLRNDILMTAAGATVGKSYIHQSDEVACYAGYLVRWRVDLRRAVPKFMAYWTQSQHFLDQIASGLVKSTIENYSASKYRDTQALVPAVSEQQAIADYLDRETAEIDAFIADQERLIELLTERRTTMISEAVEIGPLATSLGLLLSGITDGTHGTFARVDPDTGMPLLGARNIMGDRVVIDGAESYISPSDHKQIVGDGYPQRNDVLLVIVGATIGKTAIYDRDEPLSFQRSVAFLRPSAALDPRYLWLQVQGRRFQNELRLRAKVSAQPGVYLGDVTSIPVHAPPLIEQGAIAEQVLAAADSIGTTIADVQRAITLSRERRAALITAAVTGQIDVRTGRQVSVGATCETGSIADEEGEP